MTFFKIYCTFTFISLLLMSLTGKAQEFKTASMVIWPQAVGKNPEKMNGFAAYLYQELKKRGYILKLVSEDTDLKSDLNIVAWKYYKLPDKKDKKKSYLILFESPISIQIPPYKETEEHFRKIFTYDRSLLSDSPPPRKYVFLTSSHSFDNINWKQFNIPYSQRPIFSMQIASNLYNFKSIYEKRRQIAAWYIENHPSDFLLYGRNWNTFKSELSSIGQKHFDRCYKGFIPDKIKVISQTKFVFAFENAIHDGYITEKIFDVMAGGALPIYLGANDITDFIPADCFIDAKKFKSNEELHLFLKNMSEETYNHYRENIRAFIKNFHHSPFYYKTVVDVLIKNIFEEPLP